MRYVFSPHVFLKHTENCLFLYVLHDEYSTILKMCVINFLLTCNYLKTNCAWNMLIKLRDTESHSLIFSRDEGVEGLNNFNMIIKVRESRDSVVSKVIRLRAGRSGV